MFLNKKMSKSLRSLTKNEQMSESLVFLSKSLICSFLGKKWAIRLENRWANSQPWREVKKRKAVGAPTAENSWKSENVYLPCWSFILSLKYLHIYQHKIAFFYHDPLVLYLEKFVFFPFIL